MIYLVRVTPGTIAIVACEDAARAAPYLAQGYASVDQEAYLMYWRVKDFERMRELRAALPPPRQRAVGDWQPSGILVRARRHYW